MLDAETFVNSPKVLWNFIKENDVKSLYFNNEYPFYELERDRRIYQNFKENGIGVFNYHDQVIHQPGSLKTTTGNNFSVYSPFKKKWFAELDDKQLELLPIPEPKMNYIKSSDLSEYVRLILMSVKKNTGESGEDFIQNHINEFLKLKVLHIKKNETSQILKQPQCCRHI